MRKTGKLDYLELPALGGTLDVRSGPDGTRIILALPYRTRDGGTE